MAVTNSRKNIPTVGERVKAIRLDGFHYGDCVEIEFENGKKVTAHVSDLPSTLCERQIEKDVEKDVERKLDSDDIPAFHGNRP